LLVLSLLFAVSGIWLALRNLSLPLSWTADYDKERYNQIRRVIEADPQHLLGKSLEEVTKKLRLEDVPWDDFGIQQLLSTTRIYHFRGFALYVHLQLRPPGTPKSNKRWEWADFQSHGVLWLANWKPFVRIDGISDAKERMKQFWKAADEECERVNAEMKQGRRKNGR
jgi:hypothetical protein